MKKLFSLFVFVTISVAGFAQDVDNFEVGPFEVDYKGPGDYKFRLRKDVDLYDYFGLTKDSAMTAVQPESSLVKNGWNLGLQYALPGYGVTGVTDRVGVKVGRKWRIAHQLYFNANLNPVLGFSKYGRDWSYTSETVLEVAVPLSLEYSAISKQKASLYGSIGVSPTYFTSLSSKTKWGDDAYEDTKFSKSGFYVAPHLEFGGYVPAWGQLFRLGAFAHYNVNFKKTEENIYAQRRGRFVVGFEVGLLF